LKDKAFSTLPEKKPLFELRPENGLRLRRKPRCIALDQRGWGTSIATDERYDLSAMADDVEAVTRRFGLARYVLVGHSMGGKVAQIVAGRRPKELVGLVTDRACPTALRALTG
jgi:pimeloyl-ACP methyl ester carboxylesterase